MGWRAWMKIAVCVALASSVVVEVMAKQPIFVSWLVADDPGDQTILHYWERYQQQELSPTEMIDLGTMLYYRGYPKDAVGVLEAALDVDKDLNEAWFRIGLVEHQQGDLRDARIAYKRSLDLAKGHGWCNFYLGLLEEQEGNAKKAMGYYKDAFLFAPELADREVNPEIVGSNLWLGAWLSTVHDAAFKNALPMPLLHPNRVERVRSSYDDEEPKDSKAERKAKRKAKREAERGAAVAPEVNDSAGGGSAATLVPVTSATRSSKSSGSEKSAQPQAAPRNPKTKDPAKQPAQTKPDELHGGSPFGLPSNRSVSSDAYPGY